MSEDEKDYKGTRYEMILLGSGWLKETKTKRKYQRFVINNEVVLQAKDVLCVYLAKSKKNELSPQYYIFHDINARNRKKKPPVEEDDAPVDREIDDTNGQDDADNY